MRVEADRIIEELNVHSEFRIYTHIKLDGDAIASAFGLAIALQELGKKVVVLCAEPWSVGYNDAIVGFRPDTVTNGVGIAVDISAASRLGEYASEKITICIDHHRSNTCEIDLTYIG